MINSEKYNKYQVTFTCQMRYKWQICISVAAFLIINIVSIFCFNYNCQTLHWGSLIALIAVVPILYFCKAYIDFSHDCDKLIRHIALKTIVLRRLVLGVLFLSLVFKGNAGNLALNGVIVTYLIFLLIYGFYGYVPTKWYAIKHYR